MCPRSSLGSETAARAFFVCAAPEMQGEKRRLWPLFAPCRGFVVGVGAKPRLRWFSTHSGAGMEKPVYHWLFELEDMFDYFIDYLIGHIYTLEETDIDKRKERCINVCAVSPLKCSAMCFPVS